MHLQYNYSLPNTVFITLFTLTNVAHLDRVFSLFAPTYVHADLMPDIISIIVFLTGQRYGTCTVFPSTPRYSL